MRIKEIIYALEKFAPLPLQESYDNAGLQVGLTDVEASGVLLCLDVTEDVLDEAISLGCNLIVSHHPLIFGKIKKISDSNMVERCIVKAIKHDVTIYSAHTNLDNAEDGVNYKIAEKLGLEDIRLLQPRMLQVNRDNETQNVLAGSGVVATVPVPEDALDFLMRVKEVFHIDCLMHNEILDRPVKKVVICGGAGDFLLEHALEIEADAFLTGEMKYHMYFGHEQEIQIAIMGHYQSEQYTKEIIYSIIADACPDVPVYITSTDTNPIKYL